MTLYQTKNTQLFLISIFCERSDRFSVITRPYSRLHVNGLKAIPFPAAHIRIANVWEYPPPPGREGKKYWQTVTDGDGWSCKKRLDSPKNDPCAQDDDSWRLILYDDSDRDRWSRTRGSRTVILRTTWLVKRRPVTSRLTRWRPVTTRPVCRLCQDGQDIFTYEYTGRVT